MLGCVVEPVAIGHGLFLCADRHHRQFRPRLRGLPNFYTGRLFSTDDAITSYTGMPTCSASYNLESTIELDPEDLIPGTNALRITSVNNAGCGNFDEVQVVCLSPDGGGGTIGKTLLNSSYGMTSLTSQDFTFTYP